MGQKVNPKIFRIGRSQKWSSRWFDRKNFANRLKIDHLIRQFIKNKLKTAGVSGVEIERSASNINVIIYTAKPGIVIGRGGIGVEDLKREVLEKFSKQKDNLNIIIKEVEKPRLNAELVLQDISEQIEKRMRYRRVMKQAIRQVMEAQAKGVKISVSGRLDGVEIARNEVLSQGRLPLHTLRADIDYAQGTAHTTYGIIGIKVWIYRGDVFEKLSPKKVNKKYVNT